MKKLKWLEKEIDEKLKEVIIVDDSEIIDVGACYAQDCSFSFAITETGRLVVFSYNQTLWDIESNRWHFYDKYEGWLSTNEAKKEERKLKNTPVYSEFDSVKHWNDFAISLHTGGHWLGNISWAYNIAKHLCWI